MPTPAFLLQRLEELGSSLALIPEALGLLGLGSVGAELSRLDEHSDLDFFVLVKPGSQSRFLEVLDWLERLAPLVYRFQNTAEGYKALMADGVFCEFAVFEPEAFARATYAGGRWVWKREGWGEEFPLSRLPASGPAPGPQWQLGEALTNLLVGLEREARGEKLSAQRFIQHYAVDRLLALLQTITPEPENGLPRDPFSLERRCEARWPQWAEVWGACVQGYGRNRESALAILALLERHFSAPPAMVEAIRRLAARSEEAAKA